MDTPLSRRKALGLAAAGLAGAAWKLESTPDALAALQSGAVQCVLAPEQTEGPYYVAGEKVRRDITEGRPGAALALRLSVLNVATCKAIKNATVDIWHCDAGGVYSKFGAGAGANFLRGVQKTDAKGLAIFKTIYPGWYQGRTVHIHVTVHVGGNVVHTGQLYFDDALTDKVYAKAPYSARPSRTTRNANDSVYFNGGKASLLGVKADGKGGYVGSIALGVHRA
jgi:protocatechuate 3,4-dioxygenase beta subunit